MNSSHEKVGRKELQGPRPAPLKVSRESHQVRKPPLPIQYRPPVIIYSHPPKIIHTDAGEFMTLVQRLTGRSARNPNLNTQQQPPPNLYETLPPAASVSAAAAAATSVGMVLEASRSPQANEFSVSNNNLSSFSSPEEESENFTRNISPASPNIPSSSFSPLSPNFFLPSPPLLSPNLFQDLPLFTPQLQSDYSDRFFSPRHTLHKQSEVLCTPSPSLRPYMNMNGFCSTSPAGYDLFNDRP